MQRLIVAVFVVMILGGLGCGRAAPVAKKFLPTAKKAATKLLPAAKKAAPSAKPSNFSEFEDFVKRRKPVPPPVHGLRAPKGLTEAASKSASVGRKLESLRWKIPPQVYSQLIRRWQQHDAQIKSDLDRLEQPGVSESERQMLQLRIAENERKNNEIEAQLAREYG